MNLEEQRKDDNNTPLPDFISYYFSSTPPHFHCVSTFSPILLLIFIFLITFFLLNIFIVTHHNLLFHSSP